MSFFPCSSVRLCLLAVIAKQSSSLVRQVHCLTVNDWSRYSVMTSKAFIAPTRGRSRALFIASVNNRDFHTPVHVGNLPDFLYHLDLTETTTYHHRQPLARTFGKVSLVMLVTFVSQKVIWQQGVNHPGFHWIPGALYPTGLKVIDSFCTCFVAHVCKTEEFCAVCQNFCWSVAMVEKASAMSCPSLPLCPVVARSGDKPLSTIATTLANGRGND